MNKSIKMTVECQRCNGTGLYTGVGEGEGSAVICYNCDGTGAFKYVYEYNNFTGRRVREDVKRVYKSNYGYKISTGIVHFSDSAVDMDKEGVSYEDFLQGKLPNHIEKLVCPMMADQGACHRLNGFVTECNSLNGGWVGYIPDCKHSSKKADCWVRFKADDK